MKALISPNEIITNTDGTTGYRVAEVQENGFEVTEPLFWVDCLDEIIADVYYYDTSSNSITLKPVIVALNNSLANTAQPISTGTQAF